MATFDQTPASAPPPPVPHGRRVLQQALGALAAIDRTPVTTAVEELVAVAERTGHAPLCVARAVLHLLEPATHPPGHRAVVEAVHRRWAWPLHQRRHPTTAVPERVWAQVLASAASTRPPVPDRPDRTVPAQRIPRLRGTAR